MENNTQASERDITAPCEQSTCSQTQSKKQLEIEMAQASKCLLHEYEQPRDWESNQVTRTIRMLKKSTWDVHALDY